MEERIILILLKELEFLPKKKDALCSPLKLIEYCFKLNIKSDDPNIRSMTVNEMSELLGVRRQTVYDYLRFWVKKGFFVKHRYVENNKIVHAYILQANNYKMLCDVYLAKKRERLMKLINRRDKSDKID